MTKRARITALTAVALIAASSAHAQTMSLRSWGARGGFRLGEGDFDQIVVGAQANLGDVATNVRFAPNFELGFGSHATIISIDPELQYVFADNPLAEGTYFYTGGGLGIHVLSFDRGNDQIDDSETDVKINLSAGVEKELSASSGIFGEFRVSFIDGTWFDFLGGLNFLK